MGRSTRGSLGAPRAEAGAVDLAGWGRTGLGEAAPGHAGLHVCTKQQRKLCVRRGQAGALRPRFPATCKGSSSYQGHSQHSQHDVLGDTVQPGSHTHARPAPLSFLCCDCGQVTGPPCLGLPEEERVRLPVTARGLPCRRTRWNPPEHRCHADSLVTGTRHLGADTVLSINEINRFNVRDKDGASCRE